MQQRHVLTDHSCLRETTSSPNDGSTTTGKQTVVLSGKDFDEGLKALHVVVCKAKHSVQWHNYIW